MQRFPRISMALALLCFIPLAAKTLHAQEWSPAQKEVWKLEEEMMSLMSKGDIEGLYKHDHRDNVWWNYDSPVPFGYESGKRLDILIRNNNS